MNASKTVLCPLVPDDRAPLDTVGRDLIVIAKRQDVKLAGSPKCQESLDGLVRYRRVVVDENRLEVLVETAEILFIEMGTAWAMTSCMRRIA